MARCSLFMLKMPLNTTKPNIEHLPTGEPGWRESCLTCVCLWSRLLTDVELPYTVWPDNPSRICKGFHGAYWPPSLRNRVQHVGIVLSTSVCALNSALLVCGVVLCRDEYDDLCSVGDVPCTCRDTAVDQCQVCSVQSYHSTVVWTSTVSLLH